MDSTDSPFGAWYVKWLLNGQLDGAVLYSSPWYVFEPACWLACHTWTELCGSGSVVNQIGYVLGSPPHVESAFFWPIWANVRDNSGWNNRLCRKHYFSSWLWPLVVATCHVATRRSAHTECRVTVNAVPNSTVYSRMFCSLFDGMRY